MRSMGANRRCTERESGRTPRAKVPPTRDGAMTPKERGTMNANTMTAMDSVKHIPVANRHTMLAHGVAPVDDEMTDESERKERRTRSRNIYPKHGTPSYPPRFRKDYPGEVDRRAQRKVGQIAGVLRR